MLTVNTGGCIGNANPIWWKPRIEKYTFGKRIGWLYFAVGTGVVTQQMMQIIIEEFSK